MAELVEGNYEHFEGPEGPAHVREIPEQSDDDDVGDDDAEGCFLGTVHDATAEEMVVSSGNG